MSRVLMYLNHLRRLEQQMRVLSAQIASQGEGTPRQREFIRQYMHLQESHAFTRQLILRQRPDAVRKYPRH